MNARSKEQAAALTSSAPPKPPNEYDIDLFQTIETELPEHTIRTLNEVDFRGPYQYEWLKPLWRFVDDWGRGEFVDPELETAKVRFWGAAKEFSRLSALYTTPNGSGICSVRAGVSGDEPAQEAKASERGDEMNEALSIMHDHFVLLIRLGREKLPKASIKTHMSRDEISDLQRSE